ncbi:MAG: hypothetical protein ACYCXW_16605 [Solirubrobacteraceae bacterium]
MPFPLPRPPSPWPPPGPVVGADAGAPLEGVEVGGVGVEGAGGVGLGVPLDGWLAGAPWWWLTGRIAGLVDFERRAGAVRPLPAWLRRPTPAPAGRVATDRALADA